MLTYEQLKEVFRGRDAWLGAAASYETVPRVVCASYHAG